MMIQVTFLLLVSLSYAYSYSLSRPLSQFRLQSLNADDFNPKDYYKVISPESNTASSSSTQIKTEANGVIKEELFRQYPFQDKALPILSDCNNYWSGKYGDSFWLQDSDQVFVYIPIKESTKYRDISIKFDAKSIDIKIDGEDSMLINCTERLIPDGSFWSIESDKNDQRYIQLDIEKRLVIIIFALTYGYKLIITVYITYTIYTFYTN